MATAPSQNPMQPPVCHWDKFPAELKLRTFSYLDLVEPKPVKAIHGGKRDEPKSFRELCLVSKEFEDLAKDIRYKNNVYLTKRHRVHDTEGIQNILMYPNPLIGHLIRNLRLEFTVYCDHNSVKDMLRPSRSNDWHSLLRPQYPGSWFRDPQATKWQELFPFLDTLNIRLVVEDLGCVYEDENEFSHEIMSQLSEMLKYTEIIITAKRVEVEACCECYWISRPYSVTVPNTTDTDWQLLANTIKGMIKERED